MRAGVRGEVLDNDGFVDRDKFYNLGERGYKPRNESEWEELRTEFYQRVWQNDTYDVRKLVLLGADKFINQPGTAWSVTLMKPAEEKGPFLPLARAYSKRNVYLWALLREAGGSVNTLLQTIPDETKRKRIQEWDVEVMKWLAEAKRVKNYRNSRTYGQYATDVFNSMVGRRGNDDFKRYEDLLLQDDFSLRRDRRAGSL